MVGHGGGRSKSFPRETGPTGLEFGPGLYDLPAMAKSLSAQSGKPHRTAAPKVLGVTRDGVHILKPASPATHFTTREIRRAISTVRTAQKAG